MEGKATRILQPDQSIRVVRNGRSEIAFTQPLVW